LKHKEEIESLKTEQKNEIVQRLKESKSNFKEENEFFKAEPKMNNPNNLKKRIRNSKMKLSLLKPN
jgi:hypothetical protein